MNPHDELYLLRDGQRLGPFAYDKVARMLENEAIRPDTLYWREGLEEWTPLERDMDLLFPGKAFARRPPGIVAKQPDVKAPVFPLIRAFAITSGVAVGLFGLVFLIRHNNREAAKFAAQVAKTEQLNASLKSHENFAPEPPATFYTSNGVNVATNIPVSGWDNTAFAAKRFIKENANDPGSISIVNASPVVSTGQGFAQRIKYRGKNAFGATVLEEQIILMNAQGKPVGSVRNGH